MRTRLRQLPSQVRGLTLIELLVALALLSVLALLSWRTLDGMTRAQAVTQEHADRWRNWQTALAQWDADLDAAIDTDRVPPLDFDGRALRLTRSDPDQTGRLRVVGWSLQPDPASGQLRWARWTSPALLSQGELEQAWQLAAQWARNPGAQDRLQQALLIPVADWQLFYHRGGAWTNPQSAADEDNEQAQASQVTLPDGVRLLLTLPDGGSPSGQLLRDWVRPTLGGERS